MKNYRRSIFVLFVILGLATLAFAQTNPNLETGFKPFGSYDDANFDSISLTNGNLILHIPMFSYPQRGDLHVQAELYTADCGSGVKNCEKQIQNIDKALKNALKSKDQDVVNAAKAFGKLGDDNGVKVSVLSKVVDSNGNTVTATTKAQAGTGRIYCRFER